MVNPPVDFTPAKFIIHYAILFTFLGVALADVIAKKKPAFAADPVTPSHNTAAAAAAAMFRFRTMLPQIRACRLQISRQTAKPTR